MSANSFSLKFIAFHIQDIINDSAMNSAILLCKNRNEYSFPGVISSFKWRGFHQFSNHEHGSTDYKAHVQF